MKASTIALCLAAAALGGCAGRPSQLTEAQSVAAAEPAMKAKFPEDFDADRPYHAEFKDGTWWVHGTLPTSTVGGTAEALVEDGSGRVLKVWHTQ